jgi:hypothetical protein
MSHRVVTTDYEGPDRRGLQADGWDVGMVVKWIAIAGFIGTAAVTLVRIYDLPPKVKENDTRITVLENRANISDDRWNNLFTRLDRMERKIDRANR